MPGTVPAVLLFVSVALPGLVFYLVKHQRKPRLERSPLLETASLVSVGFVANLIGIAAVVGVRSLKPQLTPDPRLLVIDGKQYFDDNFQLVIVWSLLVLAIACGFAALVAYQDFNKYQFLGFLRGPIISDSAWELVFNSQELETACKWCVCVLTDGRTVAGVLASSSPDPKETGDRDLVLASPVKYQSEGGEWTSSDAARVVLTARQIALMEVRYYSDIPGDWAKEHHERASHEDSSPRRATQPD